MASRLSHTVKDILLAPKDVLKITAPRRQLDPDTLKAGIHREAAARYLEAQAGPQQLKTPHHWRTRQDPLEALWLQAKPWLEASPELEAKALFEHLLGDDPALAPGQALRTFQRRVRQWRAQHGPPREVHFPQAEFRYGSPPPAITMRTDPHSG